MVNTNKNELRLSQKLELMTAIFNRRSIRSILDIWSSQQLVEGHGFLWDKLVELHYLLQDDEFVREDVTRDMIPSATYQRQQGCDLKLDYCKGVECIWLNPECAGNKVKINMEVMAQTICGYLGTHGKSSSSESQAKTGSLKNPVA